MKRRFANRLIPHTAVWGSFRSSLQPRSPGEDESPTRQCRDRSDPLYKPRSPGEDESPTRQCGDRSDPLYKPRSNGEDEFPTRQCGDRSDPLTNRGARSTPRAKRGGGKEVLVVRKDLNDPHTAVWGISLEENGAAFVRKDLNDPHTAV
jgi:hypothetical protein